MASNSFNFWSSNLFNVYIGLYRNVSLNNAGTTLGSRCKIEGCDSRKGKYANITFHKYIVIYSSWSIVPLFNLFLAFSLPMDLVRRNKWIYQIETHNQEKVNRNIQNYMICNLHFYPEQRKLRGTHHFIDKDAFPTIFPLKR